MDNPISSAGPAVEAIARRAKDWRLVDPPSGWPHETSFGTTIDLSDDYGTGLLPEHVVEAVEVSLDSGETHYTNRPGLLPLRQAIAQKLAEEQTFSVDPDTEVVITCGGREALYVALQVLTQPGDEILIPGLRPAFIDEAIRLAQAVVVPVPLLADEGFEMKADRIAECVTDRSKVLLLINPADPTGAVIPAAEMARIAALAQKHDLTVISDESLDESLDGNVRHTSIVAFQEAAGRSVVVGSFSRLHNLASWRVGYFAGPKNITVPMRDLKQAATICTSAMSQYAALAAMTGHQGWLKRRLAELDAKREFVVKSLDEMNLPHSGPDATCFVFVDIRATGRDSEGFAAWLASEIGVAVTPGDRFGPQGEGYVRLSTWPTFSELEQAMRRMKWLLNRNCESEGL